MSRYDNNALPDPWEIVEAHWPYDGPYSDEHTSTAATMIQRLGRYLNNATQKRDGLPYVAVVAQLLAELHATVVGYEQLLRQLAGFLDREAETDSGLYDDRYDRPGSDTAHRAADALRAAIPTAGELAIDLGLAAQPASHLGSER